MTNCPHIYELLAVPSRRVANMPSMWGVFMTKWSAVDLIMVQYGWGSAMIQLQERPNHDKQQKVFCFYLPLLHGLKQSHWEFGQPPWLLGKYTYLWTEDKGYVPKAMEMQTVAESSCYHMLLTNRMMLQMGHAVLSRKDSLVLPCVCVCVCVHMCMEANNFLDSIYLYCMGPYN